MAIIGTRPMKTQVLLGVLLLGLLVQAGSALSASGLAGFHGPLRKNPKNSRHFTDESGKAILHAGSHTWSATPKSPRPEVAGHLVFIIYC